MADSKITALTSIGNTTDPAADPLVVVDVSDTSMAGTGTTKKVTVNGLLSTSPTATGNFTITGDLTVDTSTLKVDSTNNRVGINNATPLQALDVAGSVLLTNNATYVYGKTSGGNASRMLGINAANDVYIGSIDSAFSNLRINSGGTDLAILTNSGNLGLGVAPSAWGGSTALQVNNSLSLWSQSSGSARYANNVFFDGSVRKYIFTGTAAEYEQGAGRHEWKIAPSGTAGNAITFTQAMTLDASGNLVVGKSSISATTVGFEGRANGTVNSTLASSVDANATYAAYSTGAAAYRFYVGMGGTVYATNTTISAISDARLKENVRDIDVGLGAILALKPRKFDWKEGKGKNIKGDRGFIAQEFETVFPNLIDEWKDAAPAGEAPYKSVRQDLIPVLVKAIQELTARVQTLETR